MANGVDPQQLAQALAPQGAQIAQEAQGGGFAGIDPDALRSIGFMLAGALDPTGFGGRLAQGGQQFQQSNILAGEREKQQQGLAGALGLTPQGVPGPTKMTIGADGRFTATGDVGTPQQGFAQSGQTGQTAQTQQTAQQFRQPVAPISPQPQLAPPSIPQPAAVGAGAPGGAPISPFQQAQQGQDLANLLR